MFCAPVVSTFWSVCTSVCLHLLSGSFALSFINAGSQNQTHGDARFLSHRITTCGGQYLTGKFIHLRKYVPNICASFASWKQRIPTYRLNSLRCNNVCGTFWR